jgi:5-formyltetrahydrofolate cyclo-ligase
MQDWAEINRWRKASRAELIERRMKTPPATRRAWSAELERHLERVIGENGGRTVGFYWPFRAEFDPRPLIGRLLAQGRRAALPVVLAKKQPMEFRLWTPQSEMEAGVWDIPQPKARNVVVPDIVLSPLVGFDPARYRLGYGGGFFDMTLAVLDPRPFAIGVGYELGRLATVHPQPHDIAMSRIVTEAGVI